MKSTSEFLSGALGFLVCVGIGFAVGSCSCVGPTVKETPYFSPEILRAVYAATDVVGAVDKETIGRIIEEKFPAVWTEMFKYQKPRLPRWAAERENIEEAWLTGSIEKTDDPEYGKINMLAFGFDKQGMLVVKQITIGYKYKK